MGRTNIEKEFKEKLSEREIQPSKNAWDRLDAMLTVGEEKKSKSKFNWLLIAASFVGLLLIATLFFKDAQNADNAPIIVEQNSETPAEVNNRENLPAEIQQKESIATTTEPTEKSKNVNQNMASEKIIAHFQPDNSHQNQNSANSIINQNQSDPSLQADELLAVVQSNPVKESGSKAAVKVNAKNLLSQVDDVETNPTFGRKVLRQFGKNYQNVKVALSNRNIEEENH